jgi:histidinol-phosphate aminotransferase
MAKDIPSSVLEVILLENIIRSDIRNLSAYHVQESTGFVKLDAMENPYPLPEVIYNSWLENIRDVATNRYPDPKATKIAKLLKKQLGVSDDIGMLFGNGSDEIIQMLILAVAKENACILAVEPSFVMYKMIAKFCRVDFLGVDLLEDFNLDMSALTRAIVSRQPEIIFLAQPNNPTGNLFSHRQICELVELSKGLVVLDEAYTAFTDYDALPLLNQYPNVLVMRTFSKTGLAGLRLGYLLGGAKIIAEIDKIRLPYNINVLTQSLVESALQHYHLLIEQSERIIKSRNYLMDELQKIEILQVINSEANFITVRIVNCDKREGDEHNSSSQLLAQYLKEKGILIKNLGNSHRLLANCLRLTVGSESENNLMLEALRELAKSVV